MNKLEDYYAERQSVLDMPAEISSDDLAKWAVEQINNGKFMWEKYADDARNAEEKLATVKGFLKLL